MPPSTESIPDKPVFDVYGMLLVLTCIFTAGATALLWADLDKNWGWSTPTAKRAVTLTEVNDDPAKNPDIISVRKIDLDEWQVANENINGKKSEFPVKNFQWPEGYDPIANPVISGADNASTIPEAARTALLKNYSPEGATEKAPEKAPETPAPAPAPAGGAATPDAKPAEGATPAPATTTPAPTETKPAEGTPVPAAPAPAAPAPADKPAEATPAPAAPAPAAPAAPAENK